MLQSSYRYYRRLSLFDNWHKVLVGHWLPYKINSKNSLVLSVFALAGVSKLMNVAHVKESYVNTKRQEDFWVLCTDESLTGEQLRELGHLRFSFRRVIDQTQFETDQITEEQRRIENNGFKQLNAQTNCDHVYTHDEHSFESLILLIFIGWNLLLLLNLEEDIREGYEEVKWTLDFLSELFLMSFYTDYQVVD